MDVSVNYPVGAIKRHFFLGLGVGIVKRVTYAR